MLTNPKLVGKDKQKIKKKKGKKNIRPSKALPCLIILASLILIPLCRHLFVFGAKWGYLRIKEIEIKGIKRITPEQIKMWTGIKEGLNMLNFDLNCASSIAEAQPWIKSLVMERNFPSTVTIQVEENLPVAIWEDGEKRFLMDEFGFLLEEIYTKDTYINLPVLSCCKEAGFRVNQRCPFPYWSNGLSIVEDIKAMIPDMMNEVVKICILSEDQVIILLTNERKVFISMTNSPVKFPLLRALIEKVPAQWQSMGYCDLRFNDKIIFG
ncbi:MAG: cell division protein FtsQ/DivIB [bacterium]